MTTPISGTVAAGWEPVREVFADNFASQGEVGAAVSIFHRGECVVDLIGGFTDKTDAVLYSKDTLQLVFSTTKGIAAIALAMLVDRGLVDYDDLVVDHWPEFGQHGKDEATIAQLMSHQCGLYAVDGPLTIEEALDWNTITARLAATEPRWPIGTAHGYHALTYGWLIGEVIRRVDGRSPGRFVQEEIAGPLGVEMYIGLPAEHEPRVSDVTTQRSTKKESKVDPKIAAMIEKFMGPGTPAHDALSLGGVFGDGAFNQPRVRAAEIPAANGISNARSLATIYAATMQEINGTQLLSSAVRERAARTVTPENEPDKCLVLGTTFGMGFMTSGPFVPMAGPGSFGHPGAGGSVAFAQPSRDLAFAYVMNAMSANLAGDLRSQALIKAASSVADSL
ncbi:MAG: serine hydrolase domain-containing protein [Actinomycetota bacterium]